MVEETKKKCRGLFVCILVSGVVACALIVVGISMKAWWHVPSPREVVSPAGNITTYQLRGLWSYDSNGITKYKLNDEIITVSNSSYIEGVEHVRSDIPAWYEVVMAFQVIGCILTYMAFFLTIFWTIRHFRSEIQCPCYSKVALATYVTAGIFILLGIIILVGKTETKLIAWAPSVTGFGGAFCIIAASFIRWGQQDECDLQ